jgi:hypothetical protein
MQMNWRVNACMRPPAHARNAALEWSTIWVTPDFYIWTHDHTNFMVQLEHDMLTKRGKKFFFITYLTRGFLSSESDLPYRPPREIATARSGLLRGNTWLGRAPTSQYQCPLTILKTKVPNRLDTLVWTAKDYNLSGFFEQGLSYTPLSRLLIGALRFVLVFLPFQTTFFVSLILYNLWI